MSDARTTSHTVLDLLRLTTTYLAGRGIDTPRLDAEVLLAHVLHMDRVGLYVNFDRPLERSEVDHYREVVSRRAKREPVAYIIGAKEFMGRDFNVSPAVLIPRPETELLVEATAGVLSPIDAERPVRVVDMGTGSGCIAISLALQFPTARMSAVDVSAEALAIAQENARTHGVLERIEFFQGDLFAPMITGTRYDCLVSNPPYIATGDMTTLSPEVLKEPEMALVAGSDGLQIIRRLITEASMWLVPGGVLLIEIGAEQGPAVQQLGAARGYASVVIQPDYAGRDRIALLTTPGEEGRA